MTTKTYTISAGSYDSTLDATASRTGHESIEDALYALACVVGGCTIDARAVAEGRIETSLVTCETCDGDSVLVYRSQPDCDADSDGSRALATISPIGCRVCGGALRPGYAEPLCYDCALSDRELP